MTGRSTQALLLLVAALLWADIQGVTVGRTEEGVDARQVVMTRCTTCHTADLIVQQRLDRNRWNAAVSKMVHWGAQLSEQEQAQVVAYLSTRYGPDAPVIPVAEGMKELEEASRQMGSGSQGETLYGRLCVGCHGASAVGGLGPRLAQNPLIDQDKAFVEVVSKGRGQMPAWASTLTRADILAIQAWLKSLK